MMKSGMFSIFVILFVTKEVRRSGAAREKCHRGASVWLGHHKLHSRRPGGHFKEPGVVECSLLPASWYDRKPLHMGMCAKGTPPTHQLTKKRTCIETHTHWMYKLVNNEHWIVFFLFFSFPFFRCRDHPTSRDTGGLIVTTRSTPWPANPTIGWCRDGCGQLSAGWCDAGHQGDRTSRCALICFHWVDLDQPIGTQTKFPITQIL